MRHDCRHSTPLHSTHSTPLGSQVKDLDCDRDLRPSISGLTRFRARTKLLTSRNAIRGVLFLAGRHLAAQACYQRRR
jgi:hypothetical protein